MKTLRTLLLASCLSLTTVPVCRAQMTVFDPQNYTQNLLTAARTLQQINNQIQALQNQAMMLQNMASDLNPLKDISQLSGMATSLGQITSLMNQAQSIAFNVDATMAAWERAFPASYPSGVGSTTLTGNAFARWQTTMSAFQDTLKVQSQVVQNVQADTDTLNKLLGDSQSASGNLEVTQATNQLIALSTKQQLQIQSLMAAQYRANALDAARNAQVEQDGQARFQTFMGSNTAYTPQ